MHVIRKLDELPEDCHGSVVALGNFDGLHKGHQAVIEVALGEAQRRGAKAAILTFEPHPRQFFNPDTKMFRLTNEQRKLELLDKLGLDLAIVLPFDAKLASHSAQDFVNNILVDGIKLAHVVTGYDFYFGKDRQGTPELMRRYGEEYGFGVTIVEAKRDAECDYSSSRIREALQQGDVEEAARMLGHRWQVRAIVETGAGRGTGMGFPTVNLPADDCQALSHGIYAVRIYVDDRRYHGAAYLGARPTFEDGPEPKVTLEAFLFDFSGDLYGVEVAIEFVKYIRGDKVFENADALAAQISLDCESARDVLLAADCQAS